MNLKSAKIEQISSVIKAYISRLKITVVTHHSNRGWYACGTNINRHIEPINGPKTPIVTHH